MKKVSFFFITISILVSVSYAQTIVNHPAWIMNGNIYEVNTRQYTPEGTFKAFEKKLQRLKDMGVQTLWFMPINPISKKDRKGSLGSYYAVRNYMAINPEYGNLNDWKVLVNKAHAMGFKVIIDWVANHTGADHYWLEKHPDFYAKDAAGNFIAPFDWTDARKLNYSNPELVDSMIAQMKYWVTETNIDGFRCDVAGEVPDAFWTKCISELRRIKNVFMLAEGEKPSLHLDGFDATYTWSVFSTMKNIVKGESNSLSLDSAFQKYDTTFPSKALHMYFTSNHDENSWNKADFRTMPGASNAPFAVLDFTMKCNVPLIYSGQEEPFLRAIRFFDKDTILFSKYLRAPFYKKLLWLRRNHPALVSNASYKKLVTDNDKNIFAFIRKDGNQFALVILNLSDKPQKFSFKNLSSVLSKADLSNSIDAMKDGAAVKDNYLSGTISVIPWDYKIIVDGSDAAFTQKLKAIQ